MDACRKSGRVWIHRSSGGLAGPRLLVGSSGDAGSRLTARLQAVSSGPADYERNPGIGMGTKDQVGVVGLDQLHEVGEDLPLGSFQPPLAAIEDFDAGDPPGHGWISGHLQHLAGQSDIEVRREPGLVSVSAGEDVVLCQVELILADVHVVEFGLVAGLDLDLLGHFAAGIDPVALQCTENGLEAAFLCLEAALQGLYHFSMFRRILEEQVEWERISCAGSGETSLPAPQLHAALVIGIEDPHNAPSPKGPGCGACISLLYLIMGWDDKNEACEAKVRLGRTMIHSNIH